MLHFDNIRGVTDEPLSQLADVRQSVLVYANIDKGAVPRQPYLPVPVASSRNVTEKSALRIIRRQRYFRHFIGVRQRCFGRGIDQIVGHNASPLLHPPLQRTQVRPAESIRSFRVRQLRGALARGSRSACSCSSRHRSVSLARKRSRLSPRGVGLSSCDTNAASADRASLIACSNATGSNAARRSLSAAFVPALTASWRITRSQGVAGGL